MSPAERKDQWRNIHRFCHDEPAAITVLEQARTVLGDHGRHDDTCLQLRAALDHVSVESR
ncbi:hypothetical protein [Nocardia sp. NBC_01388]|uniref:hypothetical protein n=1 Tax=Nocardia sp. NBC_01388 TaxID=2903596 RepID=UPI003253CE8B